jgi:NAD+ diphosphatase
MPLQSFRNTFAGNPLDRASERRGDEAWIAARREGGRILPLWNGAPLLADGALAWLDWDLAEELPAEGDLFLGLDPEGGAVFALDLDGPNDPAAGALEGRGRFVDLRKAATLLPGDQTAIAATAKGVFEWQRRHKFCSACGQPSALADAGWKRLCPACRTEHFPRTDPVVIMLPTFGERCLLGRQAAWPTGRYSALAGFLEPGESIEEACARELREEAALETLSVAYHSSQPWPWPSSLMIGLFAEVASEVAAPDQTELEAVRWISRAEARALVEGGFEDMLPPPPEAIAHQLIRAWAFG